MRSHLNPFREGAAPAPQNTPALLSNDCGRGTTAGRRDPCACGEPPPLRARGHEPRAQGADGLPWWLRGTGLRLLLLLLALLLAVTVSVLPVLLVPLGSLSLPLLLPPLPLLVPLPLALALPLPLPPLPLSVPLALPLALPLSVLPLPLALPVLKPNTCTGWCLAPRPRGSISSAHSVLKFLLKTQHYAGSPIPAWAPSWRFHTTCLPPQPFQRGLDMTQQGLRWSRPKAFCSGESGTEGAPQSAGPCFPMHNPSTPF